MAESDVTQFLVDNTASAVLAAADPSDDVDLLLSLPTVAVDPSGIGVAPPGNGPDTTATGSPRSVTYYLDKAGNRTSVVDNNVSKTYSPNVLNQYTAVGGTAVGNGNEHELTSYQAISYTYINDERLKTVTGGNNNYQLAYDALGRCVKRTVNGAINYYIYDGEKAILQYNSGGAIIGRNLYGKGIDEILMRTDNVLKQTYYYQQDHEGSVTHLTDGTGGVIESYRYDAFGAPTIYNPSGATHANRVLFTGREYDSTFGIYEYRARAYHPGLGRFTSEDPKGFDAGDYNLFRYVHNDPLDMTDPLGLGPDLYFKPPPDPWGHEFEHTTLANAMNQRAAEMMQKLAQQDATMAQQAQKAPSLEGTNAGLRIPKVQYDTISKAGKAGVDPAYDTAKITRDREMTGPIGQVDATKSGHYFPGPVEPGMGVIKKGPDAGKQGSYIDRLTGDLPQGSHLVGYYTVHIHYDPERMQKVDAPRFSNYWGISARIIMKSPGFSGNWDRPLYSSYPP